MQEEIRERFDRVVIHVLDAIQQRMRMAGADKAGQEAVLRLCVGSCNSSTAALPSRWVGTRFASEMKRQRVWFGAATLTHMNKKRNNKNARQHQLISSQRDG